MPKSTKIVWNRSYNDQEQSVFKSACGRFLIEETQALPTRSTPKATYRAEWRFTDRSTNDYFVYPLLRQAKEHASDILLVR